MTSAPVSVVVAARWRCSTRRRPPRTRVRADRRQPGAADERAGLTDVVLVRCPTCSPRRRTRTSSSERRPGDRPGTPGTTLDPAAVATAVSAAAISSDRTAPSGSSTADPAQSTAGSLEALGVKEIVSEFSTPLTSEPRRTVNITNGASKISGTLIKPGRDVQPDRRRSGRSTRRTASSRPARSSTASTPTRGAVA